MRKLILIAFAGLALSFQGHAQDFSFKELLKLKTLSVDSFESYVTNKNYKLYNVHDERSSATFHKGRNSISYCREKTGFGRWSNEVTIRYELGNREDYKALIRQIKENDEEKNLIHNFSNDLTMTHVFVDEFTSVHLYTSFSSYKVYYEVEILSTVADKYLRRSDRFYPVDYQDYK